VVQVTKSLQDPLEVGNNLPGNSDNVGERGLGNRNPRAYNLTLNEAVDLAHAEPSSVEADVYALLVVHSRKEDVNRYRDIALHPSGGLTYTIRYDTIRYDTIRYEMLF